VIAGDTYPDECMKQFSKWFLIFEIDFERFNKVLPSLDGEF
jgi:hypothetical protein